MKALTITQKHYAILGINSSNESTEKLTFNNRILFGFFLFGFTAACQFMFILFVANGFMEYMDCVCSLSATVLIFVCFAANVFRKATLFECIHNIEKLINASKTASKLL